MQIPPRPSHGTLPRRAKASKLFFTRSWTRATAALSSGCCRPFRFNQPWHMLQFSGQLPRACSFAEGERINMYTNHIESLYNCTLYIHTFKVIWCQMYTWPYLIILYHIIYRYLQIFTALACKILPACNLGATVCSKSLHSPVGHTGLPRLSGKVCKNHGSGMVAVDHKQMQTRSWFYD